MSHLSFFILFYFFLMSQPAMSQKRWDGGGGNNQWNNPTNWSGNTLPNSADNVILDNSVITNSYTVVLPVTAVTVKTITISPLAGKSIELSLPVQNTVVPALVITGPGYGLTINSGGILRNSSGSASGNPVQVADSIRINNDGRYIHNSASGHSTNVQVFSLAAGTEKGIFELDIPAASSTISISSRTFGKFVLRSSAAGGSCNYTAAGTSRVVIRNDLDIGVGVNLNLNCSDTIFVFGDLVQEVGTLNLGNSLRSVVLNIKQHIWQSAGGIITETGTGIQSLLINGNSLQILSTKGTILNQVALVKDGSGEALLKSTLSLPYKLILKKGRIVTTQWLLTLQSSCSVEADSISGISFIDGPLKKDGLNNQGFLFPVGRLNQMRWVRLEGATGNFTIEYFKTDPNTISNIIGNGLHHISTVEYWDVSSTATATARIKLSFHDPYSGGVTDLASLRVARLINGIWENAGNTNFSGNPGSNGWVSSTAASGFSANNKSFALASATGQENPLPISEIKLSANRKNKNILFTWQMGNDMNIEHFELQKSSDGRIYNTIYSTWAVIGTLKYSYHFAGGNTNAYYRIKAWAAQTSLTYESKPVHIFSGNQKDFRIEGSNIVARSLEISVVMPKQSSLSFIIYNSHGITIKKYDLKVPEGYSLIRLNISELGSGMYFISELAGYLPVRTLRFIKQ